jgi:hypothetical protein
MKRDLSYADECAALESINLTVCFLILKALPRRAWKLIKNALILINSKILLILLFLFYGLRSTSLYEKDDC